MYGGGCALYRGITGVPAAINLGKTSVFHLQTLNPPLTHVHRHVCPHTHSKWIPMAGTRQSEEKYGWPSVLDTQLFCGYCNSRTKMVAIKAMLIKQTAVEWPPELDKTFRQVYPHISNKIFKRAHLVKHLSGIQSLFE